MNSLQIKLRSIGRKTGVIRVINRLRPKHAYEEKFHAALVHAVRPGDVVWDVGANVGIYTALFCEWVGREGEVVAFEPAPESARQIRQHVKDCPWLRVEVAALGDVDAEGVLDISGNSVDHHVEMKAEEDVTSPDCVPVIVHRGDTVCKRLGRVPDVIKVDVEGFEEEVLTGMGEVLLSPQLRSVLVEVHFLKLEQRGKPKAPLHIEALLRESGFKTKWVDASHLAATR